MSDLNTLLMMVALELPVNEVEAIKLRSYSNTQKEFENVEDDLYSRAHTVALARLNNAGLLHIINVFKSTVKSALGPTTLTDYVLQVHKNIEAVESELKRNGIRLIGKLSKKYQFQLINVIDS